MIGWVHLQRQHTPGQLPLRPIPLTDRRHRGQSNELHLLQPGRRTCRPSLYHRRLFLFAQNEWKATRRLSLTLGIRWEYESFPSVQLANPLVPQTSKLNSMKTNFGPRVGFAYDPYGSGKTVVRGGYGMFFARAINSTLYQAIIGTGAAGSQTNPQFNPGQNCAPTFPQVVAPAQQAACLGSASGNATVDYLDPN